jgi:hypothetical protein
MTGYATRWAIRLPNGRLAMANLALEWSWASREEAEQAIGYFRFNAERMGISDWNGEIVRQYCTPWLGDNDNGEHLVDELTEWLVRETGT